MTLPDPLHKSELEWVQEGNRWTAEGESLTYMIIKNDDGHYAASATEKDFGFFTSLRLAQHVCLSHEASLRSV